MKNLLAILIFVVSTTFVQAQSKYIKGKLSHMETPLVNAKISIQNSDIKTKSGLNGAYAISAEIGDIIEYSYQGLETVEIVVEDVTSVLNVSLNQMLTELDEVVVKGSNRKSQRDLELDYSHNKNLIRTAYGILNKETAPGRMIVLNDTDLSDINLCILDILKNQFAGVIVAGDCIQGGSVSIRGRSSLNNDAGAVYDVDGQVLTTAPIWLTPANIERVAVLSSLSLVTKYGFIGAGGVVVINTKVGTRDLASNKFFDRAKLRNNNYKDDAVGNDIGGLPTYLTELKESNGLDTAKESYQKNKQIYRNFAPFFIDASGYFLANGDSKFAKQIIENQMFLFEDHPVFAKAIAYNLEAHGEKEMANTIYEQIFILRPNYAQSYRDLAESYRETGNYKKSAAMYARHNYLLDEGFLVKDSIGIAPIIERESENLLALEGDKVMEGAKTINRFAKFTEFNGTRLLFEWNDSEAEFELQFVNPEKQYDTWKHTMEANALRIKDEKMKGYSCEEFLVDGSLPGRWQVNVDYKGNKKLEPTYLKVTSYYNYGTTSQRKEVQVYRLGLRNVNQKLFQLNNSSLISN
jgi:hypothetical protein